MVNIKEYEAMAKLNLSESERRIISEKAEMLTASFGALEAVETDGAEPLVTVLDVTNTLRPDVAVKAFTREEILANAPERHDEYFEAPKTLD